MGSPVMTSSCRVFATSRYRFFSGHSQQNFRHFFVRNFREGRAPPTKSSEYRQDSLQMLRKGIKVKNRKEFRKILPKNGKTATTLTKHSRKHGAASRVLWLLSTRAVEPGRNYGSTTRTRPGHGHGSTDLSDCPAVKRRIGEPFRSQPTIEEIQRNFRSIRWRARDWGQSFRESR